MDVSYLLWLQSLRESTGGVLDSFFLELSHLGLNLLYFLGGVMFWCISKKAGSCMMFACHFGASFNQLIKNTCCVYRPWIYDARIHPAGDSIRTATGYSFPSGHTQISFSGYGSLAVSSWNFNRVFAVVLVLFALLIAFSRNYLGVHFGTDVLVGILEACALIWFVHWLMTWCERSKNADLWILLGSVLFVALLFAYVALKPYPMDYIDGQLLVDPKKMAMDTYKDSSGFLGFLFGWFIERRWIRLNIAVSIPWRIVRGIVGCVLIWAIRFHLNLSFIPNSLLNSCLHQFLVLFFMSGIYPALLQGIACLGRRPAPKKEAEAPAAE